MPKAYSLHLGLNYVAPQHYDGWNGELFGCENDAHELAELAYRQGFARTDVVLTQQVTADLVRDALQHFAQLVQPDDLFLLTYSGHGGQMPDFNGDEPDGMDETWCLYDRELLDDELYTQWAYFRPGARLLVLSDSCHSGSVVRNSFYGTSNADNTTPDGNRYRFMPWNVGSRTVNAHRQLYKDISNRAREESIAAGPVKASVQLISGCQDDQLSQDLMVNGRFTMTLLQVWNQGRYDGSYARFVRDICQAMPPEQQPNNMIVGQRNATFAKQRPFTI